MLDDIHDIYTVEERLAAIDGKLDRIISFIDKTERMLDQMGEAVASNPMLSMMLGGKK